MKYLSPRRWYQVWGKVKFWQFIFFSIFILFFYLPLINLIMLAFANTYEVPALIPQQFGFKWWEYVLSQKNLISSVVNSFLIATLTTLVSLVICIPAAYAIARFQFKGKSLITFSFLLSNAFPKIGLYTSIGILFYKFHLIGTLPGVVIIHLINSLVFMIWLPSNAFRQIHKQQEEAARDVGASSFKTFFRISLPMAAPGIAIASVFTFLGSLDEAQGTLLIGFPKIKTMAVEMYGVIMEYPVSAGAVFAIMLIIPSLLIVFLFRKYLITNINSDNIGI